MVAVCRIEHAILVALELAGVLFQVPVLLPLFVALDLLQQLAMCLLRLFVLKQLELVVDGALRGVGSIMRR